MKRSWQRSRGGVRESVLRCVSRSMAFTSLWVSRGGGGGGVVVAEGGKEMAEWDDTGLGVSAA